MSRYLLLLSPHLLRSPSRSRCRRRCGACGRLSAVALAAMVGLALFGAGAPASASRIWQRVDAPTRGEPITAVAADPPSGRLAVADARGVSLAHWDEGGELRFSKVARLEGASDLTFAADGALWVASASGLWQLTADGRLHERAPKPGARGNGVHRIVSRGEWLAVATESGVLVSRDGVRWASVGGALRATPISAASFARVEATRATLWVAAATDLWRVELRADATVISAEPERVNAIPSRPSGETPVDLRTDLPGVEVAVLYASVLASLQRDEAGDRQWRVSRPLLPPGAVARRLVPGAGEFWILHDRGVSVAPTLHGQYLRGRAPAGTVAAVGLAELGGRFWLGTSEGLLQAAMQPDKSQPPKTAPENAGVSTSTPAFTSAHPVRSPDPDIRAVQRAALLYLGLDTARIARMRRGIRWRGWLPSLSLQFGIDDQSDWRRQDDQAYISNGKRFLFDRDHSGARDYDGRAILLWDFSDAAFDPEAIDLLREERQVVALRDDVLDEIHQLYFERQQLLEQLSRAAERPTGDEIAKNRLRAAELAAGLDGWTGGWFSSASRGTENRGDP